MGIFSIDSILRNENQSREHYLVKLINLHKKNVLSLDVLEFEDNIFVFSVSLDNTICIFDGHSNELITKLEVDSQLFRLLVVSNEKILCISDKKQLWSINVQQKK